MTLTLSTVPAEYVKAPVGALTTGQALTEPAQVKYTVSPGVGILRPAVQCPSPNQDDRPAGTEPELIIIHSISLPPCEFGGPHVEQLFTNCLDWGEHPYFREIEGLQVSAHLFVRRDGSIVQFAPFGRRAWHAGTSCFRGRPNCNDYSIGVELEGDDDTPYDDAQYDVLVGVLAALMETYKGLTTRRIAGHCDVAPGRKTDPGPAFDWLRLYDGLARRAEDDGEK